MDGTRLDRHCGRDDDWVAKEIRDRAAKGVGKNCGRRCCSYEVVGEKKAVHPNAHAPPHSSTPPTHLCVLPCCITLSLGGIEAA